MCGHSTVTVGLVASTSAAGPMFLKNLSTGQFIAIVAVGAVGAFSAPFLMNASLAEKARPFIDPRCDIKGNISIETGEQIYHVPGQKYYIETVISRRYGVRWFCSEADARSAGWRKSRV
jgi:hypothetical protein